MAYRYPTIKRGGKTVLKHRYLAAQRLGRAIGPDEHVHHRNHDTFDTSPGNLEPMSAEQHRQIHADARLLYPREKQCEWCGKSFIPHPTKRKRAKTCSPPCRGLLTARTERATKAAKRAHDG